MSNSHKESQPVKTMHVQVIRSERSVKDLLATLNDGKQKLGLDDECFFLRVICSYRGGRMVQTPQTLVFSRNQLSEEFAKTCGLQIVAYRWDNFKKPREDESTDFHFSGFSRDASPEDVQRDIDGVMGYLFGDRKPYKLTVPILNRVDNKIKGFGTMVFDDNVDVRTRWLCKLLLHNMISSCGNYISFHWNKPQPSQGHVSGLGQNLRQAMPIRRIMRKQNP